MHLILMFVMKYWQISMKFQYENVIQAEISRKKNACIVYMKCLFQVYFKFFIKWKRLTVMILFNFLIT